MTQKELKNQFRERINRIGICDNIKDLYPEDYIHFLNIFKRHPDYPERFIGLINVGIKPNVQFKNLEVYIIYEDSIKTVSVMKTCITGRKKPKYLIAMRVAIQQQIYEYKQQQIDFKCEICNNKENIQIDHKIPFHKLVFNFHEVCNLEKPTNFGCLSNNMKCFLPENLEYEIAWYQYHKQNAILRMLCQSCNSIHW